MLGYPIDNLYFDKYTKVIKKINKMNFKNIKCDLK